ncbi:hypothetical protein AMECASPLE_038151 [Ameca splendens]|uniref:Uncharacterized protein n=1 Tax=Ameca splendens TaxID=208324 RepID=A0ABV0XX57_9TELE
MRAVLRYPPLFPFGVVLEEGQMHFILKSSKKVCTGVLVSKSMAGSQHINSLYSTVSSKNLHIFYMSVVERGSSTRASVLEQLNKLIKKGVSFLGIPLNSLGMIVQRRILHKMKNFV